ncbi:hypothetical protein HYDPIDRAFT_76343, partial [Hydnomerulius pinastri MD-312]
KKQNQARRWSQDIIPALIRPYLAYLKDTQCLRVPSDIHAENSHLPSCAGFCTQCTLTITCILFDYVSIQSCGCCPTSVTLLTCGLFACLPVAPSVAVDLRVLELVKKLFVRMTPNTTTWCEALECF